MVLRGRWLYWTMAGLGCLLVCVGTARHLADCCENCGGGPRREYLNKSCRSGTDKVRWYGRGYAMGLYGSGKDNGIGAE